jgi:hypothetical protein
MGWSSFVVHHGNMLVHQGRVRDGDEGGIVVVAGVPAEITMGRRRGHICEAEERSSGCIGHKVIKVSK